MQTLAQPYARWMIRRDLPEVLSIDQDSFFDPLGESDIIALLRQRNAIGMVLEYDDRVIGYMIYELQRHSLELTRLAVHGEFRRTSVGTMLLDKLKSKIGSVHNSRSAIRASVPDDNLRAHLWLRANGFIAIAVMPGASGEQQYKFIWKPEFMA